MAEHKINDLMGMTMDKVREMVDSNTVIGNPIELGGGTTILPVSRVTFGFASGGSDVGAKTSKDMFGGGAGAGVTIAPVAFLVVQDGTVRTVQLMEHPNGVERAISMIPELVDKVNLMVKDKQAEKAAKEAAAAVEVPEVPGQE